jgi:SpoVK/Ycf46/Vps4 family AAA+-type ATPase
MSASLNQTLTNNYRNIASKRQRPPSDTDEQQQQQQQTAGAPSTTDATSAGTAATVTASTTSTETPSAPPTGTKPPQTNKKPRASSSSNRDNSNVETDISDAILAAVAKKQSSEFRQSRPATRLSDLAGIDSITAQVQELVFYPVRYPSLYSHLGVQPPCGLLLNGPSGCGKTFLAHAIAGELDLPFFRASGPELIGGTSGESESRIREIFQLAMDNRPSVLFIDGLDVIAGKKDVAQRGMDRRIVAQLFDCIDAVIDLSPAGSEDLANGAGVASSSSSSSSGIGSSSSSSSSSSGSSSSGSSNSNNNNSSSSNSSSINGITVGSSSSSSSTQKQGVVILIAATNR